MNIQDQIKTILDSRKNQLPKVEAEIERWNKILGDLKYLNQVIHSILQEQAIPEDLAYLLKNLNIESIDSKIPGGVSKSMLKKSRLNFDKIEKCK